MARETINGISVPIPGTGEPADFVGDLRQIATDLSASTEQSAGLAARAVTGFGTKAYDRAASGAVRAFRWVGLGDSVADLKARWAYGPLNAAWGGGKPGVAVGTDRSGTGWALPGIVYVTPTSVTAATSDFDAWFSGLVQRFATGGSCGYGTTGGANAFWDSAKVYYVKGTGPLDGGTFKVQVDGVDEGSTVDTSVGTGLGVVTITKGSVAQRALRVINLTGAHRIVGVALFNSAVGGCVYSPINQGGIALSSVTAQAWTNLTTYLDDFQPDLITLECKEDSSYFADVLDDLLTAVEASTSPATFVGIGSTPTSSGGVEQTLQNAQLRQACLSRGHRYFDSYSLFGDYASLAALGWEGDGVHPSDKANAFLGGLFVKEFGLEDHPGLTKYAPGLAASSVRAVDEVRFGGPDQTTGLPVAGRITRNIFGLIWRLVDKLSFTSTSGTEDQYSWVIRPTSAAFQQVPNGVRVGQNSVHLQSTTDGIVVSSSHVGVTPDKRLTADRLIAVTSVRVPVVTTANRPASADGDHVFDSTIGKPIWRYNGNWRDATGAVV